MLQSLPPCSLQMFFFEGADRRGTLHFIGLLAAVILGGCSGWPWREGPVPASVANCRELSQQAIVCMEANRWQEAEGLLDRAVVACPIDPDARRYYAEALLQRGATDEAISQLEEAIHLTPDDPALVIRAGEIYFYRGDHVEAQRWANEAINLDPTAVDAWALRGRIHHAGGRYRQALADFQRALGYRPEDVRLLSEVADVYMNLGRPGRTLLHLQNLEETHVSGEVPPDLMERKAEALTALGRYQEAAVCYRMVCQRVQPSAELYYNLAKAELRAGQMVRARVATQNALGIDPQHQPSTHLLSQLPASATPRR